MEPREIVPGVTHWTVRHPKIGIEVSGYWLAAPRVLLDPLQSLEVGVLCPDETALRIPLEGGGACLAVADGVVRIGDEARGDGPLALVPDSLIAETPEQVEAVKRGLRAAYRRLCELEWETLLLAHGLPLVGDGREQLRRFASA